MPSLRMVRPNLPSFLGGLSLGLVLWRWMHRADTAEIDRQRLEGEAEAERLRLRLSSVQAEHQDERAGDHEDEQQALRRAAHQEVLPGLVGPATIDLRTPTNGAAPTIGAAPTNGVSPADGTAGDDLQRIRGIGPKMARSLEAAGIRTYAQLAALSPAEVDELSTTIGAFPGRIEREDWVGSARRLLSEGAGNAQRP